jgi:hypothetical protein
VWVQVLTSYRWLDAPTREQVHRLGLIELTTAGPMEGMQTYRHQQWRAS